jgi:tetratricopeptide (TPR) repeat protein
VKPIKPSSDMLFSGLSVTFTNGWLAGVLRFCILLAIVASSGTEVSAQSDIRSSEATCGSLRNHYGPYDYRRDKDKLGIVEQYHFAPEVELLIRGQTSAYPSGDISYTLSTFPNHHRALLAMLRWGERHKSPHPPGTSRSVDCWFDRAIRFAANDTVVRVMYAGYLGRTNRVELAKQHLEVAAGYGSENGFSLYNIGLAYFDLGDYAMSLKYAHAAESAGFVRPELQGLLQGRNQWRSFNPASAASSPAAPGVQSVVPINAQPGATVPPSSIN